MYCIHDSAVVVSGKSLLCYRAPPPRLWCLSCSFLMLSSSLSVLPSAHREPAPAEFRPCLGLWSIWSIGGGPPNVDMAHSRSAAALSAAAHASSSLLRVAVSARWRFLTPLALPRLVLLVLLTPGTIARLLKRACSAPSIRFLNGTVSDGREWSCSRFSAIALCKLCPGNPRRDASDGTGARSFLSRLPSEVSPPGALGWFDEGRSRPGALNLHSKAGRGADAKIELSHWRPPSRLLAPHIGASWKVGVLGNSRRCSLSCVR